VAGTPVLTADGLRPIETLRTGDLVWSRDPLSGAEGWRPVVDTITTRPETLYHVQYARSSETSEANATVHTLSTTAEHPFYVSNRDIPGFVPAWRLQQGDLLRLADGSSAVVRQLEMEGCSAGKPFTAYNFEVEDFHTYFVGENGVWVHNSARTPCERTFSIFEAFRNRHNRQIWEPFKDTIKKLSKVESPEILNQKVFNEARKKYFDEGLTEAAPWLNGQGIAQTLQRAPDGTPIASSTNLANNLERVFGYKKIPNSQAHHIIPKAQAEAQELRDLLEKFQVHPDDASNGTFMISSRTRNQYGTNSDWLDGLGPSHQNHPSSSPYIAQLKVDLANFKNLEATPENTVKFKNELQKIAMKLMDNNYPWP
jgi:hypothetical protein